MGRPLRRHAPNTDYLVTTRCHQTRFLLRPEPAINEAVLEWLTRAQHAYPAGDGCHPSVLVLAEL